MELDDLKANWQNAGNRTKNPAELKLMTRVGNHPRLKRIRIKLLIEIVLLSAFLVVYRDVFDGADKPLWANACLVAGAGLFILNDVVGYFTLQNTVRGSNLAQSIQNFRSRLQYLLISSLCTSFLFGASLILFFSVGIDFTPAKYLLLAGMSGGLLVFIYLSYKSWRYRVSHIESAMKAFEEEG